MKVDQKYDSLRSLDVGFKLLLENQECLLEVNVVHLLSCGKSRVVDKGDTVCFLSLALLEVVDHLSKEVPELDH